MSECHTTSKQKQIIKANQMDQKNKIKILKIEDPKRKQ